MDPRHRLTTWKEISDHLGISLRTAQNLERVEGLPVHRFSENSTVFAYVDEIEDWSRRRRPRKSAASAKVGKGAPQRSGRGRLVFLLTAVALVAFSAILFLRFCSGPTVPAVLSLESGAVLGLDRERNVLWRYPVPNLDLDFYQADVPAAKKWYFILPGGLDDRGGQVVMIVNNIGMHPHLVGLDFERRRLWEVELSVALDWDGVALTTTYEPRLAGLVRSASRSLVFVAVVNIPRFSSRVIVVDPANGDIIGDYCHPGHFTTYIASDFDGDGRDELLLGGLNNPGPGPGFPAVVLLGMPSKARPAASRDIFGRPSMTPLTYLLLPRPAIKDRLGLQSLVTSF